MRIGLDAREAFRENPRGIGHYVRHLIREFGDLCPDDEFLLYHEREAPPGLPEIPGQMRPVHLDARGSRWNLWERVAMPWRMRRDDLDIYHGTFNTLPPEWPIWKGPPMVVAIHDLIVTWYDDDLDDPYVHYCRKVTDRVVRQAALVLTVSEWSRQDIIERHGADPDRVVVTYNGVHPDFLTGPPPGAAEAVRETHTEGRPYLFAVGSSLERKNTGMMLEALGHVNARKPLEHLIVISGLAEAQRGPIRERAVKGGIDHLVRWLPYLDQQELIAVYAGADLTIYPSRVEGWGVPVVESLVVGTPIVTSHTSGMLEAGGEHATFFDPTDLDDMIEKIEYAIEHRGDFDAIRDAAIARARTFTWPRAAELTYDAYRRVVG